MIKIGEKLINLHAVNWVDLKKGEDEWELRIIFNSGLILRIPYASEIAAQYDYTGIHERMVNL